MNVTRWKSSPFDKLRVNGPCNRIYETLQSLSCKPLLALRQAQHERKNINVFNTHTVHPELVEG